MSRAEQKRHRRDAIVTSAGTLLRKRGIRESSVGEVMKGAGLTIGGFYGHFQSKEEVFVEAIRAAGDTWRRLVAVAEGPTGRLRALSVVKHYLSRAHRDNVESGCPLPNTVTEVAREGERYRSAFEGQFESFVHSLAGLLDSGPAHRDDVRRVVPVAGGGRHAPVGRDPDGCHEARGALARSQMIGLEQPIQHQFRESPVKFFGHTILVTGGSAGIGLAETST